MERDYNWQDDFRDSYCLKFTNPEQFIKKKLRMLKNEMCIQPTEEELAHLNTLTTENAINCAVLGIINRHWG